MISIIHASRGRPEKSLETLHKWIDSTDTNDLEIIVSVDSDDPKLSVYMEYCVKYMFAIRSYVNHNKSSVEAINKGAAKSSGDILIVVSDDTEPLQDWDVKLLAEVKGKTDWILKTKDGIQDYIITMPIMDRAYYNRTGYIYHPEFQHLFCDTYLTCVADITGRKITSNLMFKHDHYSVNGTEPDDLHKRNDATWKQGQETFIRLMKQFSPQERARIKDPGMRSWLRNHGV